MKLGEIGVGFRSYFILNCKSKVLINLKEDINSYVNTESNHAGAPTK